MQFLFLNIVMMLADNLAYIASLTEPLSSTSSVNTYTNT